MNNNDSLVPFGSGVVVGVLGIWALVELMPLLLLAGGGYLVLKGIGSPIKGTQECVTGQPKK